ncbi:MAG: DNA recombination protein RecN [Candidatus Limnocylindrales bacterium]
MRISALRLKGLTRDYEVRFGPSDHAQSLSVISGQISTGKSSVLEFIDYCLGAGNHPRHEEFVRAGVRSALLEILLSGEHRVIERGVFTSEPEARIHQCDLSGLAAEHAVDTHPLRPPGSPESLSSVLLRSVGLAGVSLKEAPTKDASASDPLSFRDLMSLCFLPNERLGSRTMLHETQPMKALKLQQVVDAVFGVHEQALVEMSTSLRMLERERDAVAAAAATLSQFLADNAIPEEPVLSERVANATTELTNLESALASLNSEMRARTNFGDTLRTAYAEAARASRDGATRIRDRETLIRRLLPLRGQYVADIARLRFFAESRLMFDALSLRTCPACRNPLASAPQVVDGECSLCGQQVRPLEEDGIDAEREVKQIESKLAELDRYIAEVEAELANATGQLRELRVAEGAAQQALDQQVNVSLTPYLEQRDQLMQARQTLTMRRDQGLRASELRQSAARRHDHVVHLTAEANQLRERIAKLESDRRSRSVLIDTLSQRFGEILGEFGYPKLNEPHIDAHYTPMVRGLPYTQLSSGARTLVALAWHLAIFEQAVEGGDLHPGFLMLDGIQKNLRPVQGDQGDQADAEFRRPEIVTNVYEHLSRWSAGLGSGAQLIVVDNAPPEAGRSYVVVNFSADPDRPPYGFIDDIID